MSEKQYFPVPLAHLTSPIAMPFEAELPPVTPGEGPGADRPPPAEPFGMLDVEELPEAYGVDEVTLLARDPYTLFVHWEITGDGRARAGGRAGDDRFALVLRLHTRSHAGAAATQIIDERLGRDVGRGYLPAPYPGAIIDAALGVRGPDGGFTPVAFAPRLHVPHAVPDSELATEWMDVPPARTRGLRLEPPRPAQRGPAAKIPGASRRAIPTDAFPADALPGGAAAPGSPAPASAPSSPSRREP